jgi:hypothetical protein
METWIIATKLLHELFVAMHRLDSTFTPVSEGKPLFVRVMVHCHKGLLCWCRSAMKVIPILNMSQ